MTSEVMDSVLPPFNTDPESIALFRDTGRPYSTVDGSR